MLRAKRSTAMDELGWRYAHLGGIVRTPVLWGLLRWVQFVADGGLSRRHARKLACARMVALRKDGAGIRPLAVGTMFRRLAGACLLSEMKKRIAEILSPLQLGVGVEGGTGITLSTIPQMLRLRPDLVFLSWIQGMRIMRSRESTCCRLCRV